MSADFGCSPFPHTIMIEYTAAFALRHETGSPGSLKIPVLVNPASCGRSVRDSITTFVQDQWLKEIIGFQA